MFSNKFPTILLCLLSCCLITTPTFLSLNGQNLWAWKQAILGGRPAGLGGGGGLSFRPAFVTLFANLTARPVNSTTTTRPTSAITTATTRPTTAAAATTATVTTTITTRPPTTTVAVTTTRPTTLNPLQIYPGYPVPQYPGYPPPYYPGLSHLNHLSHPGLFPAMLPAYPPGLYGQGGIGTSAAAAAGPVGGVGGQVAFPAGGGQVLVGGGLGGGQVLVGGGVGGVQLPSQLPQTAPIYFPGPVRPAVRPPSLLQILQQRPLLLGK